MQLYKMKWDYRMLFGKFRKKTVKEIFDMGWGGKCYLIFVYYCVDDQTFEDSILEQLGITEMINKPGKNPEAFERWKQEHPLSEEQEMAINIRRMGNWQHKNALQRKRSRFNIAMSKMIDNADISLNLSKGRLQRKNQGHLD